MKPVTGESAGWLDVGYCSTGVEGLGPGRRVVLWVRGCSLACPGCMTPELWARGPREAQQNIQELAEKLLPLLQESDGLTLSGGEPMQQSAALTHLLRLLREQRHDLEVVTYSGYRLEEIRGLGPQTLDFLREIDILIDGRFESDEPNTLNFRGSDNQRIHLLSERAQKYATTVDAIPEAMPGERPLQIEMREDGSFRLIGIPRRGELEAYRELLQLRGITVASRKR